MTTISLGLLFCYSFFVGWYWMRRSSERTSAKDIQYPIDARNAFTSMIQRRADQAHQNGSFEFTMTSDEYIKYLRLEDYEKSPVTLYDLRLLGCRVKVLPEPIAPSRPGYLETHHV